MPIERAVLDLHGGRLDVIGVEIGHLDAGDLAQLVARHPAVVLGAGKTQAFSIPAALRSRSAAGRS